jgi:hypothetical protein
MQTWANAVKGDTSFPWLTHLTQETDVCSLGMRGLAGLGLQHENEHLLDTGWLSTSHVSF